MLSLADNRICDEAPDFDINKFFFRDLLLSEGKIQKVSYEKYKEDHTNFGLLLENSELNSKRRPIWAWLRLFNP